MRSNVAVRSNVHIRQDIELLRDGPFLAEIRGRAALLKVLKRIASPIDPITSARGLFTPRQVAELAWEQRCDVCGAIPEGPVTRNGQVQIEFRCPRGQCQTLMYRRRTALLDLSVVEEATAKTGLTVAEVVRLALDTRDFSTPLGISNQKYVPRRFTLKLTPYEFYFITDQEINSAMLSLVHDHV
jgi:hypothetical protein